MNFDDYTVIFFQHAPKPYNPEEVNPHITLLPLVRVFSRDTDKTAQMVVKAIKNIAENTMSFPMTADRKAWFGPNSDIEVLLLKNINRAHQTLHQELLNVVTPLPIQNYFPNYVGEGFHPHMTAAEMTEEAILVNSLTIVRNINGLNSGEEVLFHTFPLQATKD